MPPPDEIRPHNYWMMNKQKIVSLPFTLFSIGLRTWPVCASLSHSATWAACRSGVFRTLGQNPLAAYILHSRSAIAVHAVVPNDSPLWYCLLGFTVFFAISYGFVRYLEKHNFYLRL